MFTKKGCTTKKRKAVLKKLANVRSGKNGKTKRDRDKIERRRKWENEKRQ